MGTGAAIMAAVMLLAGPARAQTAGAAASDPAADAGNRVIYDQEYFAVYNVLTAEDMLNRIPGIQEILAEARSQAQAQTAATPQVRRGFGASGDQILINGRRLSGKTNSIATALQRIQAAQVVRVEVIRGAAPGLDVRSEGRVVNVVLREAFVAGAGTWEGTLSHYTGGAVRPGGAVSYSGDVGALNYILGATATPRFDLRRRVDPLKRPDGTLFERQVERQRIDATDTSATAALTYVFADGDRANLNGRFADQGQDEREPSDRFTVVGAAETFANTFLMLRDLTYTSWEVGGDYEHVFDRGDTVKAVFVLNGSTQTDTREFFIVTADGSRRLDRIQIQEPDRSEKILRATYRFRLDERHAFELGAEAALNTLDQTVRLIVNGNGGQREVRLFNPTARIDERRAETYATYTWNPRPDLQVEAALDTETSRLRQRGTDVNQSRRFFYLRPRLDLRYDLDPLTQLRGRIERDIGQLDFAGFATGFLNDDTANDAIRAGNPDLVPEKTWEFAVAAERRLARDQGVVAVEPFYRRITDRVEKIAVAGGTFAATGNIGTGREYGVRLNAGLRLGFAGLPRGSLDASATLRRSSVPDGITGERRDLQNLPDRQITASFRNDSDWRGLAYGVTVTHRSRTRLYDLDFLQIINLKTQLDGFIEAQLIDGITVRLDGRRIIGTGATRDRINYLGSRAGGRILSTEFRTGNFGREYKLSLRGRF